MTFRKFIFWSHLAVGLFVGLFVAYMAVTGSILALEPQILHFSERHMIPADVVRRTDCKTVGQKMATVQEQLNRTISNFQIDTDPRMPNRVQFGKEEVVLVNPCTGEVVTGGASKVRSFLVLVRNLHESAATTHERGSLYDIKNAANLGFLILIVTGLILWLPRQWRRANLKAITAVRFSLRGRARDWNLHNVAGFWFAVPLLVIVLTGAIMSYSWAESLLYRASGSPPPPPHDEKHHDGPRSTVDAPGPPLASLSVPFKTIDTKSPPPTPASKQRPAPPSTHRAPTSPHREQLATSTSLAAPQRKVQSNDQSGNEAGELEKHEDKRGDALSEPDGHPGVPHTRRRDESHDGDDGEHHAPDDEHKMSVASPPAKQEAPFLPQSAMPREHLPEAPSMPIKESTPVNHASAAPPVAAGIRAEAEHPGHEGKPGERKGGGGHRGGGHGENLTRPLTLSELLALDPLVAIAKQQKPTWTNLRLRIGGDHAQMVAFSFDQGEESEEEGRGESPELQLDRASGTILQWTKEEQLSTGQRWRRYARYLHTGQVYGLPGQVVALLASLSALLLVWTGISLSLRRFRAWRSRASRRAELNKAAEQTV